MMFHSNNCFRLVFEISVLLCISCSIGHCKIVAVPADTEVRVGHSTYLNCSISPVTADISWYHYAVGIGTGAVPNYVYLNGVILEAYQKRFRIEDDKAKGSFNLVLNSAEFEDAGLYVCQNGEVMGKAASAQLIVLGSLPTCQSNIYVEGLIGPNSCGLQQDVIQFSCSIDYNGNIPPEVEILNIKNENVVSIPKSKLSCNSFNGRLHCNYSANSNLNVQGSHFQCSTSRTRHEAESCKTDIIKIQYASSAPMSTPKSVGETVTCFADTSSTDCEYKWKWSDGVLEAPVSSEKTFTPQKDGLYRCQATCYLGQNKCSFEPSVILVSSNREVSSEPVSVTAIVSIGFAIGGLFVFLSVVVLVVYKYKIHRKRQKPDISDNDLGDYENPEVCITRLESDVGSMEPECQHKEFIKSLIYEANKSQDKIVRLTARLNQENEKSTKLLEYAITKKTENLREKIEKEDNVFQKMQPKFDEKQKRNICQKETIYTGENQLEKEDKDNPRSTASNEEIQALLLAQHKGDGDEEKVKASMGLHEITNMDK